MRYTKQKYTKYDIKIIKMWSGGKNVALYECI